MRIRKTHATRRPLPGQVMFHVDMGNGQSGGPFAVAEPLIQKSGQDRIMVELPGATREEQQRAKDVIQRSAFLQFQIVRPISDIAPALSRIDRAVLASGVEVSTTSPNGTCAECHSGYHHPFVEEWAASRHGRRDNHANENASCVGCHEARGVLAAWGVLLVLDGWDAYLRHDVSEDDIQRELQRRREELPLEAGERREILSAKAPLDLGILPDRSGGAARRIQQHRFEPA